MEKNPYVLAGNSEKIQQNSDKIPLFLTSKANKSPISPVCLDFRQNRRFWSLEIADFRRLAIYRQAQICIARHMSKIADLATYRQKWQHWISVRISQQSWNFSR